MVDPMPDVYFSETNPLMPIWPEQKMDVAWLYLFFVYGMLLFPKLVGAIIFGLRPETRAAYKSGSTYLGSVLIELLLSVLYAPIMMVQTTIATFFAVLGRPAAWTPQNRSASGYSWGETLRFHWIETLLGAGLMAAVLIGEASVLIFPIAISLVAAVPLSRLSALPVQNHAVQSLRLDTPHTLNEPKIVSLARSERARMKTVVTQSGPYDSIAAE